MGNCCKVPKKDKDKSGQKDVGDSTKHEHGSQSERKKTLSVVCESPLMNFSISYRPTIPLQDVKEQIIAKWPELQTCSFGIYRQELEIRDATATLQQLGICPGDILNLRLEQNPDNSSEIIASENSMIKCKDDILTQEITGITVKKALSGRTMAETEMTSPKRHAEELWRTALPSPPVRPLIKCDTLEASSLTNNTQDRSLKPPNATFQIRIPTGIMIESDDSNIEDAQKIKEKDNPTYFKDLQGPFFIFQTE